MGFDTALLLSLVAGLPDALVVVKLPERTICAFNPAASRIFGYPAEEVLGQSTRALHVDDESFKAFDEKGREILEANGIFRGLFEMRRATGEVFPTEHTVCLVDEGSNRPPRYAMSLIRDVTSRVQRETEVTSQQEALRSLNRRLMEVQEAERRRFARDLHDDMGQELGALRLALDELHGSLGDEASLAIVERCQGILEAVEASVRSLALDLRPSMLDDLGLVPTLRWYLRRRLSDLDIEGRLVVEGEIPEISEDARTAAFRVVQESLSNTIHHADATHVELRVEAFNGSIRLKVEDDGRGFELEKVARSVGSGESLGLLGMAERAELAGGKLAIDSAPGEGTSVHLELPIDGAMQGADGS